MFKMYVFIYTLCFIGNPFLLLKTQLSLQTIIKILRKKKKCVPFSLKGNAGDEIKLCFSFRNNHNWADEKLHNHQKKLVTSSHSP